MTANATAVQLSEGVRRVDFAAAPVSDEAKAAVAEVLSSGWLTTGPRSVAFETAFASYLGARQAVAVSSCTAALELALRALRLPPGACVLTPTMTFCGAVHAITHAGLRPVLVDVDARTLVPRPDQVGAAAGSCRPQAMVVQHMAGYPVEVTALADAAGLSPNQVVEDAAHALGTSVDAGDGTQVPVGRESRAACFSFYATKNLPMGEGGAVTTYDDELADDLRKLRLHGMSRDAWRRYEPGADWSYSVETDGLKANLSDVHAAIGLGQLKHLPDWQRRRHEVAGWYDEALGGLPGLALPVRPKRGTHAWHLYVVRVTPEFGRERGEVARALAATGVQTSVHFIPVHRFPYFRPLTRDGHFPGADLAYSQVLSLPLHPGVTEDDVGYVADRLAALRR
jgi:perosamine synthetase